MKTCYITRLGDADCAIADLTGYYNDVTGECLGQLITRINVPKRGPYRGQGIGTQLLKRILADADQEQVTLFLEVVPSDGLDVEALSAWYARHGFLPWKGQDFRIRYPK